VLSEYGVSTTLSHRTKAAHRADLQAAWLPGPHPSQVKRRNWEHRVALLQAAAENLDRPSLTLHTPAHRFTIISL